MRIVLAYSGAFPGSAASHPRGAVRNRPANLRAQQCVVLPIESRVGDKNTESRLEVAGPRAGEFLASIIL